MCANDLEGAAGELSTLCSVPPEVVAPRSLSVTVVDFADDLSQTGLLVVNGTWGRFAHDLVEDSFVGLARRQALPFSSLQIESAPDAPIAQSAIVYSDPSLAAAAAAIGSSLGLDPVSIEQGPVDPERWDVRWDSGAGDLDHS